MSNYPITEMGLELLAFFLHFDQGLLLEGLLPMSNSLLDDDEELVL